MLHISADHFYKINNKNLFNELISLSGLNSPDNAIRLRGNDIIRYKNSIECFKEGTVNSLFNALSVVQEPELIIASGDSSGQKLSTDYLVMIPFRPDKERGSSCVYCDTDPIYLSCDTNGLIGDEAGRSYHWKYKGDSFDASNYDNDMSAVSFNKTYNLSVFSHAAPVVADIVDNIFK